MTSGIRVRPRQGELGGRREEMDERGVGGEALGGKTETGSKCRFGEHLVDIAIFFRQHIRAASSAGRPYRRSR